MNKFKTLEQVSTSLNGTTYNPVAILKNTYSLDRILDFKDKTDISIYIHGVLTKDVTLKGLKDIPSSFIYQDILKMILKRYSFLSPAEVDLALEMDRYGELDGKESHYQFYGTEYVGSILQRYIAWKQQKAQELNLSRKPQQIEQQIDYEKIDREYLEVILSDLRVGKILRHINANKLYESIPNEEKLNENQRFRLFKHEEKKLKAENEIKKIKEVDQAKVKRLGELIEMSFESNLETRCKNVATCIWLAKKHNIEIKPNQF